ncbi:MAG: hypothetical protein NXI18_21700 [Alphaproteobacteria bacterium]|nr:hypothetical protein [Alphaproteobacteria bacterium]
MTLDAQTLLSFLGIAVSVGLFLVGYRTTIGARKERTRTTNEEIIHGLLKRLVLDEMVLTPDEVRRFAAGKAADHSLKSSDVLGFEPIVDRLYARVVDNDFIGSEQRTRILERIREWDSPEVDFEDLMASLTRLYDTRSRFQSSSTALLGLASGMAAAAVTAATAVTFEGVDFVLERDFVRSLAVALVASGLIMSALTILRRTRDAQEESEPASEVEFESEYERNFARMIEKSDVPFSYSRDGGYDFRLHGANGDVVVEVKTTSKQLSKKGLSELLKRLEDTVADSGARRALLVFLNPPSDHVRNLSSENVRVMGVQEFKSILRGMSRPS